MKTLLLLILTALPCAADIPVSYDDLVNLYGYPGNEQTPLRFINFVRESPFSSLEIEGLLKPLSPNEEWVAQPDGKTWLLPTAGARAVWNGEGRISVTAK